MNMHGMQQCLYSGDMQNFDVKKVLTSCFLLKVKGK